MDNAITDKCSSGIVGSVNTQDVKSSESAENFQKFIYELFENNGVINDLRAYLRGHIVNVLRSAQTGEPPSCQKHFTQRLELPYQALNILIVEYLLCMEFNYSLSVFISEIPLANMVFAYSKSLMNSTTRDPGLKFKSEDIWSILNYIGIKCDSEHVSNVLKMYKEGKNLPLLLCVMKCVHLYSEPAVDREPSQDSLLSSDKSIDEIDKTTPSRNQCKHYANCKCCRDKILRVKEKYKAKKRDLAKNKKGFIPNPHLVEPILQNIDVVEQSIIDEMFHQLKSVYESEVQMLKNSEEVRVRRSLASHAVELQKKRDEMEQRYKTRSKELERNIEQKKRFLWGLARTLRDQHQHMTRAMRDVREETCRLAAKEDSLKSQLLEAEQILRQRGEDMRNQISNELTILEQHLESMKRERDSINRERSELEKIKNLCNNVEYKRDGENLKSHYDLLKDEFGILKKYLETARIEPKCVIDRGTVTDFGECSRMDLLNNRQGLGRMSDDRVKSKQVVNDLKKQKNVNFDQSNLDEMARSRSHSRSRSLSSSSDGDRYLNDEMACLLDENDRLKHIARQQRDQIESLTSAQARLQAEMSLLPRPLTAPSSFPPHSFTQRLNSSASTNNLSHGWRKGAGEELSFLANAQPRIVVPGDNIPFIGVIRDSRHSDNRRYLMNQWRSLRRRMSPLMTRRPHLNNSFRRPASADTAVRVDAQENRKENEEISHMQRDQYAERPKTAVTEPKNREKSPKTVLLEAKEKLKIFGHSTKGQSPTPREKSPGTVLREAKLRLRKLEIEAEAVEKSYQDFRKRQEAKRTERGHSNVNIETDPKKISSCKIDITAKESTSRDYTVAQTSKTSEFENYLKDYYSKYDIGEMHFRNKNTALLQMKPIPNAFSIDKQKENYLETPLTEFRKYYNSDKRIEFKERPRSAEDRSSKHLQFIDHGSLASSKTRVERNLEGFENNLSPESMTKGATSGSNCAKYTKAKTVLGLDDIQYVEDGAKHNSMKNLEATENEHRLSSLTTNVINLDVNTYKPPIITNQEEQINDNNSSIALKAVEKSESNEYLTSPKRELSESNTEPIPKKTLAIAQPESTPPIPLSNKQYYALENSLSTPEHTDSIVSNKGSRKETISHVEHDKIKELDILEHNKKICDLPDQTDLAKDNSNETLETLEKFELSDNDNKSHIISAAAVTQLSVAEKNGKQENEINLLRIEVESTSEVNHVQITDSPTQDLLFLVKSSIDGGDSDIDVDKEKMTTQMTIIVSPKRSSRDQAKPALPYAEKNKTDDKIEKLTGDDVLTHLYQGAPNKISSVQMSELSKKEEKSLSEIEQPKETEYPDDFSADVDNYNSPSEYEDQSPISLAKTSEDENYWDS